MTFFKKSIFKREDKPYFIIWTLFSCKLFQLRVHKIIKMSDTCLHDHPWHFFSFILKGGYVEYLGDGSSRICHRFSLIYRKPNFKHRIEIHKPSWSLVLTLKNVKEWGYYVNGNFVRYDKYEGEKCIQ